MNRKLMLCGIATVSLLSTLPMVFAQQGKERAPQPANGELILAPRQEMDAYRANINALAGFAASPEVAAIARRVYMDPRWAADAARSSNVITSAIAKANPNARMSNEFVITVEPAPQESAEQSPSCCSAATQNPKWCVWIRTKKGLSIRVCKW